MRMFWLRQIRLTFLFLLILLCGCSAYADYYGSIVTKSGESYAGVEFDVRRSYEVIEIKLESGNKLVGFDQVKLIVDKEGKDITEMVLQDNYKPRADEIWKPETKQTVKKYKTKLWSVGFGMAPTYNSGIDDFFHGIKGGFGFDGSFLVALTNRLDIGVTYSQMGLDLDESYIQLYFPSLDVGHLIEYSASRYVFSVYFHRKMLDLIPKCTYPYFEMGLGAVSQRVRIGDYSASEKDLILNLGGGFRIMLVSKMALDVSGNFDMVLAGPYEGMGGFHEIAKGYIFNVSAGLLFLL